MNEKLSPATRKLLADDNGAVGLPLSQALADDLSQIIQSGPVYDPQRFAGVKLSRDTTGMLDKNLQGKADIARLNRKLLLDAYPKPMAPLPRPHKTCKRPRIVFWIPGCPCVAAHWTFVRWWAVCFCSDSGFFSQFSRLSQRLFHELGQRTGHQGPAPGFAHQTQFAFDGFLQPLNHGRPAGRVNGDTAALYRCMSMGFTDLVREPVTVVCLGFALLWIDWKLTLLAVAFVPFIILPIRVLGQKAKKPSSPA